MTNDTPQNGTLAVSVSKLEHRVDRLEDRITVQLDAVLKEITSLRTEITDERLKLAEIKVCPQPGLCLSLSGTVAEMRKELSTAQREIEKLTNWRAGIVMLTAVLVFLATIFAPSIRAALGL